MSVRDAPCPGHFWRFPEDVSGFLARPPVATPACLPACLFSLLMLGLATGDSKSTLLHQHSWRQMLEYHYSANREVLLRALQYRGLLPEPASPDRLDTVAAGGAEA